MKIMTYSHRGYKKNGLFFINLFSTSEAIISLMYLIICWHYNFYLYIIYNMSNNERPPPPKYINT